MKVTVLGAGSWGTTVAALLCRRDHEVLLWARNPDVAAEIDQQRSNAAYLPDSRLPAAVARDRRPGARPPAMPTCWWWACRPAASGTRWSRSGRTCAPWIPVVSLSKGLERGTPPAHDRGDQGGAARPPGRRAHRAQPGEGDHGRPGGGERDRDRGPGGGGGAAAGAAARTCSASTPTTTSIGCEIGGALKNVIAIAAGMAQGLGVGDNTRAGGDLPRPGRAHPPRPSRWAVRPPTFAGLAGMGDLVATCMSPQSRNRHVGEQLGPGSVAGRDPRRDAHGRRGREDVVHGRGAGRPARPAHADRPDDQRRRHRPTSGPRTPTGASSARSRPGTSPSRGEPRGPRSRPRVDRPAGFPTPLAWPRASVAAPPPRPEPPRSTSWSPSPDSSSRHRLVVVLGWLVLMVAGGIVAGPVTDRLTFDFSLPGQPGYEAEQQLIDTFGTSTADTLVAVSPCPRAARCRAARPTIAGVFDGGRGRPCPQVRVVDLGEHRRRPVRHRRRAHHLRPDPGPAAARASAPASRRRCCPALRAGGRGRRASSRPHVLRSCSPPAATPTGPSVLAETLLGAAGRPAGAALRLRVVPGLRAAAHRRGVDPDDVPARAGADLRSPTSASSCSSSSR